MSKLKELEACFKADENLEEQLCQLYQAQNHPPFSYAIRTVLAEWIENTNWAEESREGALLTQLIEQIENHLDNNVLSTILKIQFRDGLHDLKTHYDEKKESFARDVITLLENEQYYLNQSQFVATIAEIPTFNILKDIKQQIAFFKQKLNENYGTKVSEILPSIKNVLNTLHAVTIDVGDEIDDVFTRCTSLLIDVHNIVKSCTDCDDTSKKLHEILLNHLNKSLVVDQSLDDRVVKMDTHPMLYVRFLGGRVIKDKLSPVFITGTKHRSLDRPTSDFNADVVGETRSKFYLNDGRCQALFPALDITRQKREDDKEDILFHYIVCASVALCGQEFYLQASSALNVLTTAQDTVVCKGSLWWCESFCHQRRKSISQEDLLNPPSTTFQHLAVSLSSLFLHCTGKPLQPEHLLYLARRVFRSTTQADSLEHFNNKTITYEQFVKDPLPKKELSCWQWLHACISLLRTLNEEWKQGLIYGMMSKEEARRVMHGCPQGTFLLRFSESCLPSSSASLSVAVIQVSSTDGQLKIFHIRDYLSSLDIRQKGLATILYSMQVDDGDGGKRRLCEYLWPSLAPFLTLFGPPFRSCFYRKLTINIDLNEDAGKKNRVQLKSRSTNTTTCSIASNNRGSVERYNNDNHWAVEGHFKTPSSAAIQVFASVHQPHAVPTAMVKPQVPRNGTEEGGG